MRVVAIGSREKAAPKGKRDWMRSVCLLLERNDEWESRSAVSGMAVSAICFVKKARGTA